MYTERYGTCTSSGLLTSGSASYANLWSDSNLTWRPVFCVNNTNQQPTVTGYGACTLFQPTPNWLTGCDSTRAQTPHTSGIYVCLGDATVHLVSTSMTQLIWQQVCDPEDGNTPPIDN